MKIQRGTRYFLAIAAVIGLLFVADPRSVVQAFSHLSVGVILYLLFLSFVLIYISVLKWKIFLEGFGERPSLAKLYGLYLGGYFVNAFVPSYIGGDALRSWYSRKHIGMHEAVVATVLERFTGILAMAGLAFVSVWFVPQVDISVRLFVIGFAACIFATAFIAGSPYVIRVMRVMPGVKKFIRHFERLQEGYLFAATRRGAFAEAMMLSFLFHTLTVINVMASGWAVGWTESSMGELFVVVPVVLLIGFIPITPSGLGLQEGAFMVFLTGLGATPAQALGIGIILRAKALVLAILGGALLPVLKREAGEPLPAHAEAVQGARRGGGDAPTSSA